MKVELLSSTLLPEMLIYQAGRTCYQGAEDDSPPECVVANFIKKRMDEGHMSIFEHASATFRISGISRACSHQLVRHRLASYSQESQRYVRVDSPDWIIPKTILENDEAFGLIVEVLDVNALCYRDLLDMGIPKEDARFILPNATPTEIVMTANFREWLHIIRLRTGHSAQWEIREVCTMIRSTLWKIAPNVFGLEP